MLQSVGLKELDATEWPPSTTQTATFPTRVDFVSRNVQVAAKSLDFHVSLEFTIAFRTQDLQTRTNVGTVQCCAESQPSLNQYNACEVELVS